MKLGLVTDFYFPWIGGPSALLRNISRGLAARGHIVHLLAPSPSGAPSVEHDGPVLVTRARSYRVPFGYKLRASLLPWHEVSSWLDRTSPDVVHIHHPFPLSVAALSGARRRRIPVAATNHTIPECSLWGLRGRPYLYRLADASFTWWLLRILDRCDRVATPTATAARLLADLGFSGDITPISNGVDTHRFSPGPPNNALRESLGLDDRPVVLYTGRLDAEKDMSVWLRAAARLVQTADVQFAVGGKGTDRPRLEKLVETLNLARNVRFIGYVPESQLPDLYRLAGVYFITSPVELQSISTLEAVSSGLPVVAARAGALPELVSDQHTGYLFEPGDAEAAAASLATILSDAGTAKRMGQAGRAVACAHDLEESVRRYERFLEGTAHQFGQGDRRRERASAAG